MYHAARLGHLRHTATAAFRCSWARGAGARSMLKSMRMRRRCLLSFAICLALFPSTASADITAFLGLNATPTNRGVQGFGVGVNVLIVGFEFEYAHTNEDVSEAAPGLRTYMFNGLVQTPFPIAGLQFYGTAGGGIYKETLNDDSETSFGGNFGGGVKVSLLGPFQLRVDYRVFTLRGDPRHSRPQRVYAGVNLKF
jgi:hypothetical protein